ncbi:MAG: methionyl-tRNA formyltransferase [Bacteroidales bacterium]|nr:methionyl-tRNA formyltransferase [Bacteroidales bacterium]
MVKGTLKIVYMGTPEFAVAPLKALLEAGYDIPAVVTVPDKPKGRGLQLAQSDVKRFVLSYNETIGSANQISDTSDSSYTKEIIDILQPEKLRDELFLQRLKSYNADLFIVVAFRMLPECVWSMPPLGTFNLHASLLPKFRGAAPINWAIIRGESETGVTTFLLDEQIDTGTILLQQSCPIGARENVGLLYDRLMELGAELTIKTVRGLQDGSITPKPQDMTLLQDCPNCSNAPKLNRENCSIDWTKSPCEIDALVRGLSPYPCATTALSFETSNGELVIEAKIFRTEIPETTCLTNGATQQSRSVGKAHIKDGRLYVECNGGFVEIVELQPSGKKRVSAKEFVNGMVNRL